jgi:hypothetical protein
MAGKFHVRLDCRPHGKSKKTAYDFHVKCNACKGVIETFTALSHTDRDTKNQEAHMHADAQEYCDICGVGAPVPHVAEAAFDAAQMN